VRPLLAAAAAVLAVLAGCGAPDELSRLDAVELADSRERLDDALDTVETLRTSPREVRRIRAEVRRIVSRGSFETERLDEFGLAALGELQQVVPSVVETDSDGVPKNLDRPALRAFLRYSETDPKRALLGAARGEVEAIDRTVEDSEADGDTRLPAREARATGDENVEEYLRTAERDLRPIWPRLADRLRTVREEL
jgi:hypothetical protein